jgi:hypothetical protein
LHLLDSEVLLVKLIPSEVSSKRESQVAFILVSEQLEGIDKLKVGLAKILLQITSTKNINNPIRIIRLTLFSFFIVLF